MNSSTDGPRLKVWEFKNGMLKDFATLVYADDTELAAGTFDVNGKPLDWKAKPHADVFVEPRKKRAKPRADISALSPGATSTHRLTRSQGRLTVELAGPSDGAFYT